MDNKNAENEGTKVTETTFIWKIPNYGLKRENFSKTFRLNDGVVIIVDLLCTEKKFRHLFHTPTIFVEGLLAGSKPKLFKYSISTSRDGARSFQSYVKLEKSKMYTGQDRSFINERNVDQVMERSLRSLILKFEVTIKDEPFEVEPAQVAKLSAAIGKLYGDGKLANFKFIVGDKEFPVHKAIAARSQKFEEIIKKSKEGVAVMKNISPEVFSKVLEYVYTDNIKALDEQGIDSLLDAAFYYRLAGLKKMCEDIMLKQLFNGRDAADVFQIAHRNKCSWNLKSNAFEIFRNTVNKNIKEIPDHVIDQPNVFSKIARLYSEIDQCISGCKIVPESVKKSKSKSKKRKNLRFSDQTEVRIIEPTETDEEAKQPIDGSESDDGSDVVTTFIETHEVEDGKEDETNEKSVENGSGEPTVATSEVNGAGHEKYGNESGDHVATFTGDIVENKLDEADNSIVTFETIATDGAEVASEDGNDSKEASDDGTITGDTDDLGSEGDNKGEIKSAESSDINDTDKDSQKDGTEASKNAEEESDVGTFGDTEDNGSAEESEVAQALVTEPLKNDTEQLLEESDIADTVKGTDVVEPKNNETVSDDSTDSLTASEDAQIFDEKAIENDEDDSDEGCALDTTHEETPIREEFKKFLNQDISSGEE